MGDLVDRGLVIAKIEERALLRCHAHDMISYRQLKLTKWDIEDLPAADVPPALWTDEPISGTEFMTHNQGQNGFEIHFRTDDKAKYEAVQDECRRQIGHAKPAADVRPVVRGTWVKNGWSIRCSICGYDMPFATRNFCPNCGADMREKN